MSDQTSLDVLKAEWGALFDRVLAHGRRTGASEALANLVANAQAQMNAVGSSAEIQCDQPLQPAQRPPVRTTSIKREGKRAPSGSIQREVVSILQKSLVPMKVQQIIETAAENGTAMKDTSVRMALQAMRKNGAVRQNDIAEWSLTPRVAGEPFRMPSEHGRHAIREAA